MKLLGIIPIWVYGVIAALALSGAFLGGWQVQGWRCAARQKEALEQAQTRFEQQLARQQTESEKYEQSREAGRVESRARETEVRTIYRGRIVPAECEPDPVAVGVLQRAIDSANASPAEPGG